MSGIDLKGLQSGNLVEYQRPSGNHPAHGAFLGWHSTDDGQIRLIARNLE